MIPFVDVVYDGDDYEFEISLEPKDPCCFGFKVVYHNGSSLLLQNIESIDISCVPGMEYIENDEELYDREPFTVEVGNTEDIDKIADILRELGDHYLEEDVASIPLSLTAYTGTKREMRKNSIEFFHIPFFHVQIYQRKELCQWIFHGSCYLSCWVRLQIQSVMFSAVQRKIKLR